MRKIFLIPLLTLLCTVMAFATNVGNLTELQAALANGGEITLTADITGINAALNVNKSVAIDGQGHMLSGAIANKGILTLVGTNDNMLEVAISNLHIKNTTAKGIAINIGGYLDSLSIDNSTLECPTKGNNKSIEFDGPQPQNAKIGIRNSTLIASASGYPIRSYNPMNLYMVNCSTSGYCALNFQANIETSSNPAVYTGFAGSRGSKIFAENCYFDAPNVHSGGTNGFACFVFRDDGVDLTLKNCGMNAEALGNAGQTAFDLGGGYSPVERITDNGNHAINITLEGDNTHINGQFVSSYLHCGVKQTAEPTTTAQGYFIYETGYAAKYSVAPSASYIPTEAFEGKTTVNFVVKGGTYSINPENVSFRGHVLIDQLTEEQKQQDPDNLPDSKFEQLGITIPDGYEVKTITMEGVANPLYRVVKKAAEKAPGVLYDLNDNVETAGNGQNPATSFELSDGSAMTLNQATTKAGYVEVSEGTTVTVATDQTLVINNGLDVQGTSVVTAKPGSALVIGEGGIVTKSSSSIVVEANQNGAASLLLDPTITVNQTPELTVKMTAKQVGIADGDYHWHRFAMPVNGITTLPKTPDRATKLFYWNYDANGGEGDWASIASLTDMQPFHGYNLSTTNEGLEDVVYTFKGKLAGNINKTLSLTHQGYNFFGNSYTGYIKLSTLANEITGNSDLDWTVWVWDTEHQTYASVSLKALQEAEAVSEEFASAMYKDWQREIAPMQTFILRLPNTDNAETEVDYASTIWGNPRYTAATSALSAAPARRNATAVEGNIIRLAVADENGSSDAILLMEKNNYSDNYDNGYDAVKYMNSNTINMFTTIDGEDLSSVATDNLEGKTLTIQTKEAVNYTLSVEAVFGKAYALRDNVTGKVIAIEEGTTYEFAAQPNNTIEGRFEIIAPAKLPTAIENTEVKANVKGIYSITGQYLGEDFNALPAGVYVVNGVKIVK